MLHNSAVKYQWNNMYVIALQIHLTMLISEHFTNLTGEDEHER